MNKWDHRWDADKQMIKPDKGGYNEFVRLWELAGDKERMKMAAFNPKWYGQYISRNREG